MFNRQSRNTRSNSEVVIFAHVLPKKHAPGTLAGCKSNLMVAQIYRAPKLGSTFPMAWRAAAILTMFFGVAIDISRLPKAYSPFHGPVASVSRTWGLDLAQAGFQIADSASTLRRR
jgi:hypothetical protein